jgi:hypothetical protein
MVAVNSPGREEVGLLPVPAQIRHRPRVALQHRLADVLGALLPVQELDLGTGCG